MSRFIIRTGARIVVFVAGRFPVPGRKRLFVTAVVPVF
jgi:hypothetical protein